MNRKGSLSLSVNAIVVLILAITMLGLGLGFMKGMFSKVSTNVDKAISSSELENPATAEDPMTLSAKEVSIKRGQTGRVDIGFFNGLNANQAVTLTASCTPAFTDTTNTKLTFPTAAKTVNINQDTTWSILLQVSPTETSNTFVCTTTLTAVNGAVSTPYSREFFLRVQ